MGVHGSVYDDFVAALAERAAALNVGNGPDPGTDIGPLIDDTRYGFASSFFSQDTHRVWRVSEALDTGIVAVNVALFTTPVAPFGGMKQSGLETHNHRPSPRE